MEFVFMLLGNKIKLCKCIFMPNN